MSERDTTVGPNQALRLAPLCVDATGLGVLLGVSERAVRRLDDGGRIPAAIQLGALKRWHVEEIQSWLRAGAPVRRVWAATREDAS